MRKNLPSTSQHSFAEYPHAVLPRSVFVRPSGHKTAFNVGDLIPIFSDEVLPGDTFNLRSKLFGRLSTLLHPYMDNVYLDTHYFFVPFRILWSNFEKFCGYQENPDDSIDFTFPKIVPAESSGGFGIGSIADYLGFPPNIEDTWMISMYHRAYNLIWNDYYRNQNLQDSLVVDLGNGPDDVTDYVIKKRNKRKDYFTSALPWPQKGAQVSIPLTGDLPIVADGDITWHQDQTSGDGRSFTQRADSYNATSLTIAGSGGGAVGMSGNMQYESGLQGDLSGISAVSINAFRQSYSLQRFLEKDARGGTRYFEMLNAHFGVSSPDSRLQRPEYLGGASTMINVHPVSQTSETSDDSPLGELAGFAIISPNTHGFVKSFVEHGIILGLASVRADMTYQQGVDRRFTRETRYDLYWPAFAQLGEQAVLNKEIYLQGDSVVDGSDIVDEQVFGYQERYGEYRYKPSIVTGVMRSIASQSLDTWHLAYDFDSLPVLGDEFSQENPPLDRVLAVQSSEQPQIILDCYHHLKCARVMPMYGIPGLNDRF